MTIMLPPKRPEISREEVMALAREAGFHGDAFTFGRRGYYRDTMGVVGENDVAVYDDMMAIVTPKVFATFNANTDPQRSAVGMATLEPGRWLFGKATHHPGTPKAYPCLMQVEPVIVRREGTDTVDVGFTHPKYGECLGDSRWKGMFAIQHHCGFRSEVGSEGCQTIYPAQWPEYYATVISEMGRLNVSVIPYVLTVRPRA